MDNNLQSNQYGQMDFNLPHDVVQLPSGGRFYKSKKKSVKVGYLTAADENIFSTLLTNNRTEQVIFNIIRAKLYEPDLKPEDLLYGDIEAIMIFLRNTSFGAEYTFNLDDPKTNQKFEAKVTLDELNIKRPEVEPDENGFFSTTLPRSQATVKLRLLTLSEESELETMAQTYPQGRIAPKVSWRLNKQIIELNGSTDRQEIAKFIEVMPIMDSKHIKNFLSVNEPGLDLTKNILAPSGEKVTVRVSFGVEFFRPFF
jgi:hypothetical protein